MASAAASAGGDGREQAPPLQGVRVVDITRNISGPFCTMMLGDMGAEVIKVEDPNGGDELRRLFRYEGRSQADEDYFYMFNRNKRSIVIDLKQPRGRDVLMGLVRESDVLVENLAPGVSARLGFDWEAVHGENPRLVYAAISGYGKALRGQCRTDKAYDGVVQADSGVLSANRCSDGTPRRVSMPLGDIAAGMYTAYAIAASLLRAARAGRGEYIDVAMYDSLVSLQGPAAVEALVTGGAAPRLGNQVTHRVPQNVYAAADGRHVFLTTNERSWLALCRAFGLHQVAMDPRFNTNQARVRNREHIDSLIAARIGAMTAEEAVGLLARHGVPSSIVRNLDEVLKGEQVASRQMLLWADHPASGRIPLLGFPYKLTFGPCGVFRPPPLLGEDTDDILRTLLNRSTEEIADLQGTAAVASYPQTSHPQKASH